MTEEKLKEFLLECLKIWEIKRTLSSAIIQKIDGTIEEAIELDPHFAAVVYGLLNGTDFALIEDYAQLNWTVEEYIGLK